MHHRHGALRRRRTHRTKQRVGDSFLVPVADDVRAGQDEEHHDRYSLVAEVLDDGQLIGGQVRLFGYSPVVPSAYGNRFAYGHVVESDRNLIVSGGLGFSILPVRLGVRPEILQIDLG